MKDTLKYLRLQNNLSQNKIADYLGISRQMYIKYELGETEPTVKCVRELCKLYKVSYDVLIDDKFKSKMTDSAQTENQAKIYNVLPNTDSLIVTDPEVAYTAGNVNADALNFRNVWGLLFKLNTDDLIRVASKALNLVEDKKKKERAPEVKMSQEEKIRLFNKFNGYIKDVKIEDWKAEHLKALDERYGV